MIALEQLEHDQGPFSIQRRIKNLVDKNLLWEIVLEQVGHDSGQFPIQFYV